MVFLDPSELKWKPYVLTWLNNIPFLLPDTAKVLNYVHILSNFIMYVVKQLACCFVGMICTNTCTTGQVELY